MDGPLERVKVIDLAGFGALPYGTLLVAEQADVFLEPFRPGVVERLGVGPDVVMTRNPRIVYVRITGRGQEGPLAKSAGHSLNYEALTRPNLPFTRHPSRRSITVTRRLPKRGCRRDISSTAARSLASSHRSRRT